MKLYLVCLLTLGLSLMSMFSFSQGCSDAGVCSVGSLSIVQFKYEILPVEVNKVNPMSAEDPEFLQPGKKSSQHASDQLSTKEGAAGSGKDTVASGVQNPGKTQGGNHSSSVRNADTVRAVHYFNKYPKWSFQFSTYYGLGDNKTSIIIPQLDANVMLVKQKLFAQLKLPYMFISGKLGSVNGVGDPTFSLSYVAKEKGRTILSFTAGAKVPSNKANASKDSLALPMTYQTSLGSSDILLGARYKYNKWDISLAYQHAFNANENGYMHVSGIDSTSTYNKYFESNKLKRADDLAFRLNRDFKYKKAVAAVGLLFIYHMQNDVITNAAGQKVQATGSQGLTLNMNLAGAVRASDHIEFNYVVAAPAVVRKARPDGLTRSMVFILGFKYSF